MKDNFPPRELKNMIRSTTLYEWVSAESEIHIIRFKHI